MSTTTTTACPPAFSLCVYCGSRNGADPTDMALAAQVGRWIAAMGGQLVYGGGRAGLMGAVADAALSGGARVVGVIPKALAERERTHHGCTRLHVVDTMHERKRVMADHSDAFLALPGGIGTFEEFFETWSWRQLGYHDKPLGLLNHRGYYEELLQFMRQCVRRGFMDDSQMRLIDVDANAEALLQRLIQAAGFPGKTRLENI